MPVLFSYSHKVYLHQGEYLKQNGECYFNFYNSVADTVCISAYSTSKCEMAMETFQRNAIEQRVKR